MKIAHGKGRTEFGPGVQIELTGDEVALAIMAWLRGQGVEIWGPRTIRVGGELELDGSIYVDPSGDVYHNGGEKISGRGPKHDSK